MDIIFNGRKVSESGNLTVAELLTKQQIDARAVIVERNGEVYRENCLANGDQINVYRVSAGG